MPLIGYARVSTDGQTPLPQSEALQTVGCLEIFEEHASGGNRARPVLARVLERVQSGDTLVVVRIDRLARSLSHLLKVIERLCHVIDAPRPPAWPSVMISKASQPCLQGFRFPRPVIYYAV